MNDENKTPDLIEEARTTGEAYIASFGGDLKAVCADLRRRANEEGRTVVFGQSKPPQAWQTPSAILPRKAVYARSEGSRTVILWPLAG